MMKTSERSGRKAETPGKTRTIAICGTATSSRDQILALPPEVEAWGLNANYQWQPRIDRMFDMHDPVRFRHYKTEEHQNWLKTAKCPIFMMQKYEDVPTSVAYPFDFVLRDGKLPKFFTSSVDYMMALAIAEEVSEIRLLGVDMATDSEWAYQRDGCMFWHGVAIAAGIKVYIPEASPLYLGGRTLYGIEPEKDRLRELADWKEVVKQQIGDMQTQFPDFLADEIFEMKVTLRTAATFEQLKETLCAWLKKVSDKLEDHRMNLAGCEGAIQILAKMRDGGA